MLYIICGSDAFARKEAFDKLRADLDKDGSLATNAVTFDAKAASPQEVMAACNTVPFLGENRLVVLEGALTASRPRKQTKSRGKDTPPAEDDPEGELNEEEAGSGKWLPLAEYAPNMPPTTTLILLDSEAGKTNPLLRALAPFANVIECAAPRDRDLPGWVSGRAKKIGLKIDGDAAKLLAGLIGPDVWMLANELDKLHAYAGSEIVREKDVRELVSRANEHKSWDLTDAILDGQGAKAARVLNEMLEDGTHPQAIIGMIAGRYRRAAIVREMLDRGESGSAIAEKVGLKGFGVDRAIEQAQRWSLPAIRDAYARLIEADLDKKSGLMEDDRLAIELAVQDLASRTAVTARR